MSIEKSIIIRIREGVSVSEKEVIDMVGTFIRHSQSGVTTFVNGHAVSMDESKSGKIFNVWKTVDEGK